jgi:LysM repeat protein
VHTVKAGETLYSIANMYGTTVDAIVAANSLANPSVLVVGQKLTIPGASGSSGGTSGGTSSGSTGSATGCRISHTVKPGEWVWQIARNYGVSPYDILSANGLTINSARLLYPGQVLCIP